ncbi:hypothetical protein AMK59_6604 [Oryctes borbonicus]|uniref:Glycoside hydrolase n=1 Tax=Oryctes borbonicus TaxID=1629725 RepID=A0A0T6AT75_9SCAR|nr:hypothetical protein AMK59_6604 [Oryctes borbonicus]
MVYSKNWITEGYQFLNYIFFTEPNAYHYIFNYTVTPMQLAIDFATLRKILDKYPMYKNKLLVGPDITNPAPENGESIIYLKDFLVHNGGQSVDAITFHQYMIHFF